MSGRFTFSLAMRAALLATCLCGGAAQAAAEQPAPADAAAGEIVVTAQKRSESINNVGLSITALTGDDLKKKGIADVQDLAKVTPGLTFAMAQLSVPVYTLRGMGFFDTSLGAYPAVSVYVDEVPLAFPATTIQAGLDLERVEVLKGPQGILFGANSTGGAINYIAAKPTDELKTGLDLSYGRFNTFEGSGFISGPLSSTLKARLAVKGSHGGGWQESYTRKDSNANSRLMAARLLLDWTPTETARFELNVNGWQDKSTPQVPQYYVKTLLFPTSPAAPLLNAQPFSPNTPRAADWTPGFPKGNIRLFQASLRGDIDVTDDITLTSLTSYVKFKRDVRADQDGMALLAANWSNKGDISTFYQELRLANSGSDKLRWVVGGNYERSNVADDILNVFTAATVPSVYGFGISEWTSRQKMRNWAVFANVDYGITDQLTVKVGGRYTETKRTADNCDKDPGDGNVSAFFTGLASALRGSPIPPIPPGACIGLDANFLPSNYVGTLPEHNFSWRVGLDYKPTNDVLLYANLAKGYKAGSYPSLAAALNTQYNPAVQESVMSYEAGFKVSTLNRRLSLQGAAFYYNYKDKQIRSKVLDLVFGPLDNLTNVPRSDVKGVELSATLAPVAGLTISAGGTYIETKIKEGSGINVLGAPVNFAGSEMPFAPKFQFNGSIDYSVPVSSTLNVFAGATVTHNSATYSIIGEDPVTKLPAYTLLDLRAGVETADGRWRVQIWGRNVTNEFYLTNAFRLTDQVVRYTGRPATYGVTVSFRN